MTTLLASALTVANPAPPPSGWSKPASAQNGQILVAGGVNAFRRSTGTGTQMSIWTDNINYTGNTLVAKFTHAANATQGSNDSARVVFLNSSGNGYALWLNQAGTEARIYKVIASNLDTTQIATFTSYGNGYNQKFELRCIDKAAGTFQFWRNDVQIGSNFTDTTYASLEKIGWGVNGGNITNVETGALFSALTITNPIVSGGAFSGTFDGAADGAGTISTGGQTVPITFAGGGTTFSGTWPAFADGLVYPVTNGSTLTFTIAQGASSTTITSVFILPANYAYTPIGTVITDPTYLGSVYSLTTGWAIYCDETQLGGMAIYPDSRVDVTNDGTFVCFVHRVTGSKDLIELTVTVNGGAIVTVTGGLSVAGLSVSGPSVSGLSVVGL